MKKSVLNVCLVFAVVLSFSAAALADEGMWLYNRFPSQQVSQKYGWAPDQQWLDHLRLSSLRMGASASFVSPDGLIFTNHHVGAGCVHDISTAEHDYMKEGFYAGPDKTKEPKCPGLQVQVLVEIRDITKDVQSAAQLGMSEADAAKAQRTLMSKLEKDCSDPKQNTRCETVTLYSGGMYHLYKYKIYRDIRLVMAPEFDIAFFGGDPDNFTYPRYDLDITFLRAYENDKPVQPKDYLKFSTTGVKEGDLIFISGHPGSTGRLLTMAQLEYLRDVAYPYRLKVLKRSIDNLLEFSKTSPENARAAERVLFGYQNSYKALTGYQSGLLDEKQMATKAADEQKMRSIVNANPQMKAEFGGAWDAVALAANYQRQNFKRLTFAEGIVSGRMASIARSLVRAAAERQKPNEDRMRDYQDPLLPSLQAQLLSTAPISKPLDVLLLTVSLQDAVEALGVNDPLVKTVLDGKIPEVRAKELIEGSKLDVVATRKLLWDGGQTAIDASTDPMIQLIKKIDPEARVVRKDVEDKVDAVVRKNGGLIAKARFQLYGEKAAPDATGTLRLSYGTVKGYAVNGKQIPYFTTMGGAFQLEAAHSAAFPYTLPRSWHEAKRTGKLKLSTPLDTVNTGDSIGGNSGSPVVNKQGELIGILFDGNIESLPWNFFFEDKVGRSVLTDSRAVIESLKNIYNAKPLADELVGGK